MVTEVSFEALRRVQLAEKSSPALSPLEEDFYEAYRKLVEGLHEKLSANFSLEAANAYESTRKILVDLARRREQKIMMRAMHDFESGRVGGEGLALEEKELYTSLIKLISVYQPWLKGEGQAAKAAESAPLDAPAGLVKLRLLVDVPRFVGIKGPVGPLQAGSVTQLSGEDAQLLMGQNAAEKTV